MLSLALREVSQIQYVVGKHIILDLWRMQIFTEEGKDQRGINKKVSKHVTDDAGIMGDMGQCAV